VGPCSRCGGNDPFAINTKKQVNCRQCKKGGNIIALVMFLDDCDFLTACQTLTGEPAPRTNGKGNGKAHGHITEIVTGRYAYEYADGRINRVVERIEYRDPAGNPAVKNRSHSSSAESDDW
jgi:hypothetical protein